MNTSTSQESLNRGPTMYCIHCGKSILVGSAFCSHCGKPQVVATIERRPSQPNNQPEYLKYVSVWASGPSMNKGFFNLVHRGFSIAILLADKSGKMTTYDGILHIKLRGTWEGKVQIKKEYFSIYEFEKFKDWGYIYEHTEPCIISGQQKVEVVFETKEGKNISLSFWQQVNAFNNL